MNEHLHDKIQDYLEGKMTVEERGYFEEKIAADEELSSLVSMHRTIETDMQNNERYSVHEDALKKTLGEFNRTYFNKEAEQAGKIVPFASNKVFKIIASVAASVIIAVCCFLWLQPNNNTQQLAGDYIKDNLTLLSQTMDASRDSLNLGIAAYNNKEYGRALELFEGVCKSEPTNSAAKKYAGLAYLITNNYDKALQQFQELANIDGLYSNPGKFFQAVTLMQRNKKGDEEKAKRLLEEVVEEKAEGARESEEWLKKLR